MPADASLMRIGELARRTGMAEATLRAWERRYGIPRPQRTVGGHRLYSEQDVVRLSRVQRLVEQGWAVGAAARRVGREMATGGVAVVAHRPSGSADAQREQLQRAFEHFDATGAHRALDEALRAEPVVVVLDSVVGPVVRRLGAALAGDDALAAAQAHFGLALLRTRLAGLLADMTAAAGDVAVVAGVGGDAAELDALAHAIPLAGAGWVVRSLGHDVPGRAVRAAAEAVDAALVVAVATERSRAAAFLEELGDDLGGRLVVGAGSGFRELGESVPVTVAVIDAPAAELAAAVQEHRTSAAR